MGKVIQLLDAERTRAATVRVVFTRPVPADRMWDTLNAFFTKELSAMQEAGIPVARCAVIDVDREE